MSHKTLGLLAFAVSASSALVLAQGRFPLRGTFDERLQALEERMDAIEDRLARAEETISGYLQPAPDRLSAASEARLDRLEVRLIRLETNPTTCDCTSQNARTLLDRIRSVERQMARLRYSQVR